MCKMREQEPRTSEIKWNEKLEHSDCIHVLRYNNWKSHVYWYWFALWNIEYCFILLVCYSFDR